MKRSCLLVPRKGTKLFSELKDTFGHNTASIIFNRVVTEKFINDFEDSLTLDSEGIPTYSSVVQLPIIKDYVGEQNVLKVLNRKYSRTLPNTAQNVKTLVDDAININNSEKDHVALVDYTDDGNLVLKIVSSNEENRRTAAYQRAIQELNDTIVKQLGTVGVTIENMSEVEVAAGRVGEVNFRHLKSIANEFGGLIRVANNMEGTTALSEEFSHLLVRVYRNSPLMQRALVWLKNKDNCKQVLGDKFDRYYEEYQQNMDLLAEEALGQMLQKQFISTFTPREKTPLFGRIKDYLKNLFSRINPGQYQDNIDSIERGLSQFAKDIIERKTPLTEEQLKQAASDDHFYALNAKGKKQVEVLRKVANRFQRGSNFTQNTTDGSEKQAKRSAANKAIAAANTGAIKEETVAALAELLNISLDELKSAYEKLGNLDKQTLQDKFITLRNTLYTIQQFGSSIEELYSVLSEDYLSDPDILKQHFMIQEKRDSLKEFRTLEAVIPVNTKGKTNSQIAQIIVRDSSKMTLQGDYYVDKQGNKYLRVTQAIQAAYEGESFDPNSPWATPSTNIGTGIDELVRDFLSGRITYNKSKKKYEVNGRDLADVYPNGSNESLNIFVGQIQHLRKQLTDGGITIIPRDVTVSGTINTTDGLGHVHTVRVAGTLDLLGYDGKGNWYIYDMKTHRGEISQETKDKYARQVSLYKKLLEDKYGIKINSLSIIPIKVSYPAPVGTTYGTTKYSVDPIKPIDYNGREGNQLVANGEPFKGAKPFLEDIMPVPVKNDPFDYKKLANDPLNGLSDVKGVIMQLLSDVSSQFDKLKLQFENSSFNEFVAFIKPFIGDTIEISDGNGGLKKVPIEKVVEHADRDITTVQHLFTTMADNPDGLIKIFDKIVKIQKAQQRANTINMSQRILALAKEYEDKGIRTYDWIFEDDNKRYITKIFVNGEDYSYDKYKYQQAFEAYQKELDKIYGEHPQIGSQEYKDKKEKQEKWISENTEEIFIQGIRTVIPNHKLYPSKWSSLTTTQKEFYDKWMALKYELDRLLPPNATTLTNTIKIRKSGIEIAGSLLKKGDIAGLVRQAKTSFMRDFSDTQNYKGIVGLNDEEVLQLPLYYLNSSDTKDLTHDVIGSLIAYADMAYNYAAMQEVINPLEIGRNWALEKRDIDRRRGGKSLFQRNRVGQNIETVQGKINPRDSKFGQLLDEFFESKIYEKFVEDNGEVAGVDVNKTAGVFLKLVSAVQLGFNEFAHMANILTGIGMQNIEAFASQYFSARELAKADSIFMANLPSYIGDIGARVIHSKLALSNEKFNVRQDFRRNAKNKDYLNRTLLGRLFGPRVQFLGQDSGDFWLYNRTFIAMALRYKLIDTKNNNSEISLWDALETTEVVPGKPEYGMKLIIKDGVVKKKDGTEFSERDIQMFSDKVGDVNRHLFGVYNDEDSVMARRRLWGRFIMQYRDWIPTQFRYRFGGMTSNLDTGEKFEGYYRTTLKFIYEVGKELKNGDKSIKQIFRELEDFQKANIKKATFEIAQYGILCALIAFLLGGSKDKDRSWLKKTLSALALRERTELGAVAASPRMFSEIFNIVKSPIAASSVLNDISDLTTLFNPFAYMDEIESGNYKGHSSAYKAFVESPLTLWYRNFRRLSKPELMERYYEQLK